MRLVNDKQEPIEVKSVDLFALISQMFLISVGIATWVFSPMVMILSHCRFTNPWSKVAGLGGAVLAILFLEVPVYQVVIGFVVGLYVADGFQRQVGIFQLISQSLAVALVSAFGCLAWASNIQHLNIYDYWVMLVSDWIARFQTGNPLQSSMNWEVVKNLILFEGPFLYLSATLMSIWLAMGMSAHFEWVKEQSSPYSAQSLRRFRIPRWIGFAFIASFIGTLTVSSQYQYVVGGIFRVLSGFMFIQGSICLALLLEQRKVRKGLRTVIYLFGVVLGFYALVGMGIMSPWILRRKGISPQILKENLEEQI